MSGKGEFSRNKNERNDKQVWEHGKHLLLKLRRMRKDVDRVASMGVTASPGRFTTKDIDSIARSVSSVIGFFPVWIMAEAMPYRRPSPFPGLSPGLAVQMKGWVKK